MTRTCTKCGATYDGKFCKPCKKIYLQEYKKANKEKVYAVEMAWRKANKEKDTATKLRWKEKNPLADKEYYEANAEKIKQRTKDWYEANKERVAANKTDHYEQNPEARINAKPCVKCGSVERYKNGSCAACAKEHRKKHLEERAAKQREYVKKTPGYAEKAKEYLIKYVRDNKDTIQASKLEWARKNKDHINAKSRDWRKQNPEKAFLIAKRYRENNPEAKALIAHNRRTRIKGDKPTTDIVRKLWAKQNGKCVCCNASLDEGYHLDHIMPLALGGRHIDENLQLLTPKCNRSKSAKHPDVWRAEKGIPF